MAYKTASRILYAGNKRELARMTGMSERTVYNRNEHPEKTRLEEFAQIVKVKGLTVGEVMEVLKNLQW